MRFKGYWRQTSGSSEPEYRLFNTNDYKAVGMLYSPTAGMPVLEAHQLVNYWNSDSGNKFWLWEK